MRKEMREGAFTCVAGRCFSVERNFACHHTLGYAGPRPIGKGGRRPARPDPAGAVRYVDLVVATELVSRPYPQVVRVRGLSWAADRPVRFLADHDEAKVLGAVQNFWIESVRWRGRRIGDALFARAALLPEGQSAWADACWRLTQRGERPACSMGAAARREAADGQFLLRAEIFEVSVLTTGRPGAIPGARIWSSFASSSEEVA